MSKILVAIGGSPSSMDAEGDAIEIARKINELNYNSLNKDIQHL